MESKQNLLLCIRHCENYLRKCCKLSKEPSKSDIVEIIAKALNEPNINVPDLEPNESKSDEKSKKLRLEGNKMLEKQHFMKAIIAYNSALVEAKSNLAQSLAVANRAVVLRRLKHFRLAIKDIEMALYMGHPDCFKLYCRKTTILTQDLDCFEEAQAFLSTLASSTSQTELQKLQQIVRETKLHAKSDMKPKNFEKVINRSVFKELREDENCFLHKSLAINYESAVQNRFVVAQERIDVGTTLIVNRTNICYVDLTRTTRQCYACLQSAILSFLPCQKCSNVVFCSVECFEAYRDQHEKGDCELLNHILSLIRGNIKEQDVRMFQLLMMALKTVNTPSNLDFLNKEEESNKKLISKETLIKANISEILRELTVHLEDCHTMFRVAAVIILGKMCFDQDIMRTCALFHLFSAFAFNNHVVQEIRGVGNTVNLGASGVALFPVVASIVNHSCDPNTITVVQGLTQTTVATRIIERGEPITHVYQCHFGDTPLNIRRRQLKSAFHFDCDCDACSQNYPLAPHLNSNTQKATKIYLKLNNSINNLMTNMEENEETKTVKALKLYIERQKVLCEYVKRPHLLLLTNRAAIQDHLWLLRGNRVQDLNNKCLLKALYP